MTAEHISNKDGIDTCMTRSAIVNIHNLVMNDTGLTSEELHNIWDEVDICLDGGEKPINPMLLCESEFDLNSMIAGAMVIIGILVTEMDTYKESKLKDRKNIEAHIIDDMSHNVAYN